MTTKNDLPINDNGVPHQTTEEGYDTLTTQQGVPVSDDQNHLKAGERGPMLMDDFHFREKIFHFDHERIPERVVHARGAAMHAGRARARAMHMCPRSRPARTRWHAHHAWRLPRAPFAPWPQGVNYWGAAPAMKLWHKNRCWRP